MGLVQCVRVGWSFFPTGYFLQEDVRDPPSCIQRPECEVRSVAGPAVAGILAQVWKSGEE